MLNFSINSWIDGGSHLPSVRGLFSHPSQDCVLPKSPFGADSKARNLALPGHLVKRSRVNSEQFANFFYRQDFLIVGHDAPFLFRNCGEGNLCVRAQ
jgi:hypothetical protein